MTNSTTKGNITFYALGGAGINLGYMFERCRTDETLGMATINPVYADTSTSNLRPDIPQEHFFHFKDEQFKDKVDGSGGIRATNADAIFGQIDNFLEKHRPSSTCIVAHSSAGGSGSVIGPATVRALVERGVKQLVVITVGDATTSTRIKNTLYTEAGYEIICDETQTCIAMADFENTNENTRRDVDSDIFNLIAGLAALFSRENAELDAMDLNKFLHINESTSYPPHLVKLEMFTGDLTAANAGEGIATVATLSTDRDTNFVKMLVEHACVGYPPKDGGMHEHAGVPRHFTTRAYAFNEKADRLRALMDEQEKVRRGRIGSSTLAQGVKSGKVGIPL